MENNIDKLHVDIYTKKGQYPSNDELKEDIQKIAAVIREDLTLDDVKILDIEARISGLDNKIAALVRVNKALSNDIIGKTDDLRVALNKILVCIEAIDARLIYLENKGIINWFKRLFKKIFK